MSSRELVVLGLLKDCDTFTHQINQLRESQAELDEDRVGVIANRTDKSIVIAQ